MPSVSNRWKLSGVDTATTTNGKSREKAKEKQCRQQQQIKEGAMRTRKL